MNFSNILSRIAEVDPEVYERTSPRRRVIKNWMRGATLATLPLALGALFNKAYGKTAVTKEITDILNFALTLEYLEYTFYKEALNVSVGPAAADPLIPSGLAQSAITTIAEHERLHIEFLTKTIIYANLPNVKPVEKPEFDFTAGGLFPSVLDDYDVFLAVAQTLEDTGVRAYKGGAPALMPDNDILTAALRIHSTEARHAAHIRTMRRDTPSGIVVGVVKPWIVGSQSNIGSSAAESSYAGEENTLQANIQIKNINGQVITEADASASFDEPLKMEDVQAIVKPFIVV